MWASLLIHLEVESNVVIPQALDMGFEILELIPRLLGHPKHGLKCLAYGCWPKPLDWVFFIKPWNS